MKLGTAAERDALAGLLRQSAAGDQQAFAELYKRTSAKLFGVCLGILRDRDEAEEALQEAYITAWSRADRFDVSRATAMTWLIAVARNKAIDRLRRQHDESTGDVHELAATDLTPALEAEQSEDRERLQRCLDLLDGQQQAVVREAFFSGATYIDLAARCRVPLGTMKSWIRRSLARLRTCLEQ